MIYLDNAATSRFKPQSVIDSYIAEAKNSSNSGRAGHSDCTELASKIYKAREAIKEYVGADDRYEVIFSGGCTESLNLAILGYLRGKRGNVVTTVLEHNSVLRPLKHIETEGEIDVIHISPGNDGIVTANMIREAINDKTLLIAVTHTSNVTGAEQDIAEIGKLAESKGIPFLVDSAQGLGHTTIDMSNQHIDMLACCGHKGLQAMQGVGFLVIKRDIQLKPIRFGGTGTSSESLSQPDIIPEGFECGTLNSPAIVSLIPAIDWLHSHEIKMWQNIKYLSGELIYGLKQLSPVTLYSSYPSSVISFNIADISSTEVADILNESDIAVRAGLHCAPLTHKHLGTLECGTVRASIGHNNSIMDIRKLLYAVEKIVRAIT